jgi:hypothetical protein
MLLGSGIVAGSTGPRGADRPVPIKAAKMPPIRYHPPSGGSPRARGLCAPGPPLATISPRACACVAIPVPKGAKLPPIIPPGQKPYFGPTGRSGPGSGLGRGSIDRSLAGLLGPLESMAIIPPGCARGAISWGVISY